MTIENMIEVPADKLEELISGTYDLSEPINMGFLHYRPGPLDPDDAKAILKAGKERYNEDALHDSHDLAPFIYMDYVHGRCCKMVVFKMKGEDRFFIRNDWFDHTPEQLQELLGRIEGQNSERKEA